MSSFRFLVDDWNPVDRAAAIECLSAVQANSGYPNPVGVAADGGMDAWLERLPFVHRLAGRTAIRGDSGFQLVGHIGSARLPPEDLFAQAWRELGGDSSVAQMITRLFVAASTSGLGLGRALIGELLERLRADGAIALVSAEAARHEARSLYESLGAVEEGSYRNRAGLLLTVYRFL